jgi:hypothetical protein
MGGSGGAETAIDAEAARMSDMMRKRFKISSSLAGSVS